MAQLDPKSYPGDWSWDHKKPWKEEMARTDAMLEAIDDQCISFGVADGCATYFVKSLKPLVLQHVPHGDAYQVDYALIRGLRRADVEQRLNRVKLFKRKSVQPAPPAPPLPKKVKKATE